MPFNQITNPKLNTKFLFFLSLMIVCIYVYVFAVISIKVYSSYEWRQPIINGSASVNLLG